MIMEFIDIGTEPQITLCLHSNTTRTDFRLNAKIVKYLDQTTAIVQLLDMTSSPLNFEGVQINVEYKVDNSPPYFWNQVKLVWYKGSYVLRVPLPRGIKINRRSSYRVSVGVFVRTNHKALPSAIIKDISHSGFALSSSNKEAVLEIGEAISASFSDQGMTIHIHGKLVRTEKRDDLIIYGFYFTAPCSNLDQYIAMKQRPLRGKKR